MCLWCGNNGDSYKYENMWFCSKECLIKHLESKRETLREEVETAKNIYDFKREKLNHIQDELNTWRNKD